MPPWLVLGLLLASLLGAVAVAWFLRHRGAGSVAAEPELPGRERLAARALFQHREGILITDADGTIVDVNEAFTRITGYTREEVLGRKPSLLQSGRHGPEFYQRLWQQLKETGFWSGEVWNRRRNGEVFAEHLVISAVRGADGQGAVSHYVGLISDLTPEKLYQHELERIAHYDALTNLPNRVLLGDRLNQAMVQARRRGSRVAVAYVDLDGFKEINDRHGHDVGDRFLCAVGERMRAALREGDTVARLGGDEFVALLIDLPDQPAFEKLLARLVEALSRPITVAQRAFPVSASIGVTFFPQAEEMAADQLLRQADQAMYQAKHGGKNQVCYHRPEANGNGHGQGAESARAVELPRP